MRLKPSLFYAIIILVVISSCKKKEALTDNIFKFKDYISRTTSGQVSIAQPIQINLTNAVDGWSPQQEILDQIISISPKTEGKLIAINNHSIQFTPSESLIPDTEYTVTLKLDDIYTSVPTAFKKYTFKFKTISPNFTISTNDLQTYSKEWQYINGVIRLADVVALADVKQLIQASQNNATLAIKWDESYKNSNIFEFKIDSINRLVDDSKINVKWNGNPIKSKNKGENTIIIPGINNFVIVDVNVIQSPEQHIAINFSDPLKKQQNFDGLVTIQNTKNPKFIVDGNNLKIYPNNSVVGNLQVEVFQGIKNTDNFKLKTPFSETISFEALKPNVRLITNSGILPSSQDLKFNFEAVNLKAVDVRIIKVFKNNVLQFLQNNNLNGSDNYNIKRVGRRIAKKTIPLVDKHSQNSGRWKAYSIDLAELFNADKGSIYRVELSFKKEYAYYNCANASNENVDTDALYDDYESDLTANNNNSDEDLIEEAYWDNLIYSYQNYHYNWRERDNPCHEAYYNEDRIISSNLIASNLGVIAKRGNNTSYYFAVTDILNTEPQADAKIELFNFQQQLIAKTTTDKDGLAIIDSDINAAFAIISKNNNTSYVKLTDGSALSLSKFNVSGKTLQRGLKGFIYGERGVWRPGDSLHLTFMLNDNANKLPAGHPVKLEVTDANGRLAYKKIKQEGVNNFYRFSVPTTAQDKTGNWNAKVSVGGATFYKLLKVETIKPNRLKLKWILKIMCLLIQNRYKVNYLLIGFTVLQQNI